MLSHETGSSREGEAESGVRRIPRRHGDQAKRPKTRAGAFIAVIEIIKSRGQDYDAGEHTLKIRSGSGHRGVPQGSGAAAPQHYATDIHGQTFRDRGGCAGWSDRGRDFRRFHDHGGGRVGRGKNRAGYPTAARRCHAAESAGAAGVARRASGANPAQCRDTWSESSGAG